MAVVSPMGVRWLTDGMETSLVAIMSVALPLIAYRASASPSTPLRYAGLSLLGAALFLLRIEMGLLVVAASACLWLRRLDTKGETPTLGLSAYRLARIALSDSGLLVGAVTCALVVYVVFGQVLPDTAVAKSAVWGVDDALRRLGSSTASSLTLGAGLSALWAVSAASAAHAAWTGRRGALALVAANAVIVVLFLGVAVRGQEIAGFRNVIWALLFMTTWNVASIPQHDPDCRERSGARCRWRRCCGKDGDSRSAGIARGSLDSRRTISSNRIVEGRSASILRYAVSKIWVVSPAYRA